MSCINWRPWFYAKLLWRKPPQKCLNCQVSEFFFFTDYTSPDFIFYVPYLYIYFFFTLVFLQIPLEAVLSLSLLLEGSACQDKAIQPLHVLLTKDPFQTQAGYSTLGRSFHLHKLLSCIQNYLTLNPFGITACLNSGKTLAWASQGVLESSIYSSI